MSIVLRYYTIYPVHRATARMGDELAASVPYSGGAVKLVVEYNRGKVSVFLGDETSPVFETEDFADFLNTVKYGHLKFNGSRARINSLKVMKPKRAD